MLKYGTKVLGHGGAKESNCQSVRHVGGQTVLIKMLKKIMLVKNPVGFIGYVIITG
jgi:hypothetical protein